MTICNIKQLLFKNISYILDFFFNYYILQTKQKKTKQTKTVIILKLSNLLFFNK